MNKRINYQNLSIFLTIITLSLADILTKYIFTEKQFFTQNIIFIYFSKNYGSSFGIFSKLTYYSTFIIILSLIIIMLLTYHYKKFRTSTPLTLFFIFLLSGLIGNTYDRLLFGYVRDFIGIKNLFIFNLADLYITLSAIFLIYNETKSQK